MPGVENLREWAGDLAAEVESGACHAFGVVDIAGFSERVGAELEAANWKVESHGQRLKVSDGRFTEQVNLLRGVGARSQESGVRRESKSKRESKRRRPEERVCATRQRGRIDGVERA